MLMQLISNFPLLAMLLGGVGATLGLYLLSISTFHNVLKKGTGIFLTLVMTYVFIVGLAFSLEEMIRKHPDAYIQEPSEETADNPMVKAYNEEVLRLYSESK